jgi:hypothetical protein
MAASISDVRLPSDNGHQRDVPARPFRTRKRHMQRGKRRHYSITSSTRASGVGGAERFGCLEVDPQLVPRLHRQLGRISPLRILSM